ncbi:hypothetical protein BLS_007424 [Venturia inaequalis]|uniref:Uncharacterized protein n=1 Tax=Venturia inaequalis TaxID=5025 RepID=A0A8H3U9B7_VENIN|nr:hypothetical protein BLS_007424 [Venturia inaequalis]
MSVESAPLASSLTNTKWHKPEYALPKPSLKFLFHLECNMESFMHIGNGPHGDRSTVIFKGGRFEGPDLRGEILPGDWEIIRNHDGDQQTAHLDTRYNLRTHDGAVIYLQTTGTRTGKREVLENLGEKEVSPTEFRMRLHITAETGDERYSWLNQAVIVASSGRVQDMVIYDAYQLL